MARSGLEIVVQVEDRSWQALWPGLPNETRRFLETVAKHPKLKVPKGEVTVVFASDERLQALNAQFRGKHRPTNVLSFPDTATPLGGMALALGTVRQEARGQRKEFIHHTKHMILHGFLHLLGHDHQTSREARLMERLETAILSEMGIPNPYLIRTTPRA
jgi:probable rRNA maturation factor